MPYYIAGSIGDGNYSLKVSTNAVNGRLLLFEFVQLHTSSVLPPNTIQRSAHLADGTNLGRIHEHLEDVPA